MVSSYLVGYAYLRHALYILSPIPQTVAYAPLSGVKSIRVPPAHFSLMLHEHVNPPTVAYAPLSRGKSIRIYLAHFINKFEFVFCCRFF